MGKRDEQHSRTLEFSMIDTNLHLPAVLFIMQMSRLTRRCIKERKGK